MFFIRLISFSLLFLFHSTLNAQVIVKPGGPLARFEVSMPSGIEMPSNFKLMFRNKTNYRVSIDFDTVYEVGEGELCVSFQYSDHHLRSSMTHNCHHIKKYETKKFELSVLKLSFNKEVFKVDLGKHPGSFELQKLEKNLPSPTTAVLISKDTGSSDEIHTLPVWPGTYKIVPRRSYDLFSKLKTHQVNVGRLTTKKLHIKYPDLRSTIEVSAEERMFPIEERYIAGRQKSTDTSVDYLVQTTGSGELGVQQLATLSLTLGLLRGLVDRIMD